MSREILFERGIGEKRAALIEGGRICRAWIEPDGVTIRPGDVRAGRLTTILVPGERGIVTITNGVGTNDTHDDILVSPLPRTLSKGATCHVEITRTARPEDGQMRLPRGRITDGPEKSAPDLETYLRGLGPALRLLGPYDPDDLEENGWSELLEEARTGHVIFAQGRLLISPTPGMTVIDIDGPGPIKELAHAGAVASAHAITRLNLGGAIGIDFPTLSDKATRTHLGDIMDATLPPPFQRTGVNGFGFMQIVRRRVWPALIEMMQAEPLRAAAMALLRQAERMPGTQVETAECQLVAPAPVIDWITARPHLLDELQRRVHIPIRLHRQEKGG